MVNIAATADSDSIVGTLHIAAPPQRVFRALTDPTELMRWWTGDEEYRCLKWECDLRVGGRWVTEWTHPSRGELHLGGEYSEVDPPRLLAYTWEPSWGDRS